LAGTDVETAPANLSFTVTVNPTHGVLSGTAPNLTYTPTANYNGPDSFKFTVTDRGDPDNCSPVGPACAAALTSAPATVTITITPVNDAPVATPQNLNTTEDTPLAITLSGVDVETTAANLTYTLVASPLHGMLSGS